MKNLLKVSRTVKEVLTDFPHTRNSDNFLYLKVLERFAAGRGINLYKISVVDFLCNTKSLKFPYFETVRRARQKIQEKCPELQAVPEVEFARMQKEEVFHNYAIGEVVE